MSSLESHSVEPANQEVSLKGMLAEAQARQRERLKEKGEEKGSTESTEPLQHLSNVTMENAAKRVHV